MMKETTQRRYLRSTLRVVLVLLLLALVVLVVCTGLKLWFSMKVPGEDYYLRPSLMTAGAGLLAAFVAGIFFFWRNWIAGKQLEHTGKQLEYTNKQLDHTNKQLEYTNKQLENADKQLETSQKQLENAQLSLQEERYKKGVELLGHKSQVVRIGGLYALHQLAEDSSDKWALPVLELMCIFVRTPPRDEERAEETPDKGKAEETPDQDKAEGSGKKQLRRDVQEAVQLLGTRGLDRREEEERGWEKPKERGKGKNPGGGRLDFRGADLAWGSWEGVDLERANFFGATLTGADFYGATLTDAYFEGATLTKAEFQEAMLEKANFERATLTEAHFEGATLTKAEFRGATLTGAHFEWATLGWANVLEADITGADLKEANLSGVILLARRSVKGEVRFEHVKGLTREQVEAGWHEEGWPPVKIEEDKDSWTPRMVRRKSQMKVELTRADWEKLGLDQRPKLEVRRPPEE